MFFLILTRRLIMFVTTFNYIKKILITASLLLFVVNVHAKTSVGELELVNNEHSTEQDKQTELAVLLNTDISGSINGLVASIKVKQTFQNTQNNWVNGRYVFPLPEGAAVDSFRMRIGERIIDGLIKEKEQAEREFIAAKRSGKKAGLLKQHRPNLFSISVANIGPNEEVVTELTLVNNVHFENNTFSLRLPTTITPRYIPNATTKQTSSEEIENALNSSISKVISNSKEIDLNTSTGWATNTARVIDASDITPPQTHDIGQQTSHHFSLSLSVNAGLPLQTVNSQTHLISTDFVSESHVNVTLASNTEKMDSDLVIRWQATIGNTPEAAFFQQKFKNAYYSMLMVTPPQVNTNLTLPRDVTFIVDTSGSMSGTSMRQAKQALHDGLDYLSPSDRFNIIEFNSEFSSLYSQSEAVTLGKINDAHSMIDRLSSGGGTEMLAPLKYALNTEHDAAYLKQIIFITDGSIGNENELFRMIQSDLDDARLFTVSIGSAPNTHFMEKAAQFGRGSHTVINRLNQVSEKMADLFEKITSPVMRNIQVAWPQSQDVESYPSKIPDLYSGQPLTLIVKSKTPINKAEISGELVNSPWQQTLNLTSGNQQKTDNLDTVWARQKVAALMDQLRSSDNGSEEIKTDIINLGISHNIITKFTAFIAVEKTPSKPKTEQASQQNIPNLMPKGNTMPAPQTATPAGLLTLLGGLLLLLSYLSKHYVRIRTRITALSAFAVRSNQTGS